MCGGGGKGTGGYSQQGGPWGNLTPSQQQTQVASPEAIGWYQQAMKQAQQAAAQPFQQYGTRPEDFVAQLNAQQQAAQQGIAGQAAATQPFAQMGAGMQAAAGMGNAAQMVGAYMNPFMQQVVSPIQQALQQQQGQQLAQQQAEAIRGGAFGGDRAGIQRQLLRGQQQLGTGQALSPLYQTGYGQALGAAQTDLARQLAAGQGLSQAGLQAQQASLGAGTLGQQTQQAGINALYNQFQQQRAYPFQTAQFLAGIAGGLGPLLGQTSYQAQATNPFGMFLARGGVAENRMGGAVHEAGDYADGGSVGRDAYALRGSVAGDDDIASILAAQEGMYQGADKASGTEIPTSGIQAAKGLETVQFGKPQEQQPLSERIKSLTGAAKDVVGLGKDIYGAFSGKSGLSKNDSDKKDSGSSGLGTLAKAGLSAAANYFLPGSGLLAGLFADGGVVGYANGGDPEDDNIFERGLLGAESAGRQFDKYGRTITSPKGALGIAQIMPTTAPEAAKLAGLEYDPERLRSDEAYNKALGRAYYNEQLRKFGTPELALAAYNAGPNRVQKALEKAGPGGDVLSLLPRETQDYVPRALGLAGANVEEAIRQAKARDKGFMALDTSDRRGAEAPQEEGILREENVLPALSGLGAALEGMVTSPTVGIGGALLRGAGAGMKEGVRSALEVPKIRAETGRLEAEIPKIGAETKFRQAETAEKLQDVFGKSIFQRGDMWFVRQADGNVVSLYDWMKSPKPVWGGEGGAPTTVTGGAQEPIGITPDKTVMPAGNVNYGPASQKAAQEEQRALYSLNPQRVKEQSAKYLDKVNDDAAAAQQQKIYHNDIAKIIAEAASSTGMGTMGAAAPLRAQITDYLNTAARSAGLIPSDASMFGENDTQSEMLKKLQTLQAQAGVSAAGQKAYGSLVTLIGTLPSLEQTPQAAAFNAASNLVNNQRLVDKQLHAQAYGQNSGEMYYHAGPAFERDNAPSKYVAEQNALSKMMLDKGDPSKNLPSGAKVIAAMTSGAVTPEQIEDYFMKRYKLKGMSRYFVGPQ